MSILQLRKSRRRKSSEVTEPGWYLQASRLPIQCSSCVITSHLKIIPPFWSHCHLLLWLWHDCLWAQLGPEAACSDALNTCVDWHGMLRPSCLGLPVRPAAFRRSLGRKGGLGYSGVLRLDQSHCPESRQLWVQAAPLEQASPLGKTGPCSEQGRDFILQSQRARGSSSPCSEPEAVFVLNCPNVYPCNNGTQVRLDTGFAVFLFNF